VSVSTDAVSVPTCCADHGLGLSAGVARYPPVPSARDPDNAKNASPG